MRYLLTGAQMKAVDQFSIQKVGIPSMVLMERAAMAVAEEVIEDTEQEQSVMIAAGTGNNGADGLAVARLLSHRGYRDITVLALGNPEKATEEWKCQKKILDFLQIPVIMVQEKPIEEYIDIDAYEVVIDALFGIGLTRSVEGTWRDVIEEINHADAWVVSVDISSGISSDTGAVLGTAVMADKTVTFGYEKLGQVLYPGADYAGEVKIKDIGFPASAIEQIEKKAVTYTEEDLSLLPYRPDYANKGTFGKVLVVAGAKNMAGAAWFSASAAYRMGAGLVRILTVEENRQILQTLLPDAVMTTYEKENIKWEVVQKCLDSATVIVLGPGLSLEEHAAKLVDYILEHREIPVILDADGINLTAKSEKWRSAQKDGLILTPHLQELSRLTGKTVDLLASDLKEEAEMLAKQQGGIWICKDARTVVAGGGEETLVNTSGNNGMSVGGSGDVLTGVIAGLLAGGCQASVATRLGVYIHGLAGDRAREKFGTYSMRAVDIIDALADITKEGY